MPALGIRKTNSARASVAAVMEADYVVGDDAAVFGCEVKALVLFLLVPHASSPAPVETTTIAAARHFALIIGENASQTNQAPLKFADDDAFRAAELLSRFVHEEDLVLLATTDQQSDLRFHSWRARASAPSRRHLAKAVDQLRGRLESARRQGHRTVLFIYYAGHVELLDGYGNLTLADALLSHLELEEEVLQVLPADRIHFIVDACHAGALLAMRGQEGPTPRVRRIKRQARSMQAFFQRMPHVGVIFSTSKAERTYEDVRYESGLFSHVVRSGLLGGADINGDRRISYRELRGFLNGAFATVRPAVFQPNTFVYAPHEARLPGAEAQEIIVDYAAASTIELPADLSGHLTLQDDRRLRVAELNKSRGPTIHWFFPRAGARRYTLYKTTSSTSMIASLMASVGWGDVPTTVGQWTAPDDETLRDRGDVPARFDGLFERPFLLADLDALAAPTIESALTPPAWHWAASIGGGVEQGHIEGLGAVINVAVGVRAARGAWSTGMRLILGTADGKADAFDYRFFRLGAEFNPRYFLPLFGISSGVMGVEFGAVGGSALDIQRDFPVTSIGSSGAVVNSEETRSALSVRAAGQLSWLWIIDDSFELSIDFEVGGRFRSVRGANDAFAQTLAGQLVLYWLP